MNKLIILSILTFGSISMADQTNMNALNRVGAYAKLRGSSLQQYDFCKTQLIDQSKPLKGFKDALPQGITNACALVLIGGGDW